MIHSPTYNNTQSDDDDNIQNEMNPTHMNTPFTYTSIIFWVKSRLELLDTKVLQTTTLIYFALLSVDFEPRV